MKYAFVLVILTIAGASGKGSADATVVPQLGFDLELDAWPHVCKGNVKKCSDGFTYAFNYQAASLDSTPGERVVLSTGAQTPLSSGVVVVDYGTATGRHAFVVADGTDRWEAEAKLKRDLEMRIVFTWKKGEALKVYANGQLVAKDATAETRFVAEGSIDLYPYLTIGYRNDGPKPKTLPDLHVMKLDISEKEFTEAEVKADAGDFISVDPIQPHVSLPDFTIDASTTKLEAGHTASFSLIGTFPRGTKISAKFNDPAVVSLERIVTPDETVPYTWTTPGTYVVEFTASLLEDSVTKLINIQVTEEDHHVKVEYLKIITTPGKEKMSVDVEVAVHGGPDINCIIGYGDNSKVTEEVITEAGKIFTTNHLYAEEGQYTIIATCQNKFSKKEARNDIIVRDVITSFAPSEVMKYVIDDHERNSLRIDIPPQHVDGLALDITLDGVKKPYHEKSTYVLLDHGFVTCVGEHRMSIFSGDAELDTFALIAQKKIHKVDFKVKQHNGPIVNALLGSKLDFDLKIEEDGRFDIVWDFGDGQTETLTATEVMAKKNIERSKSYSKTGTYKFKIQVANLVDIWEHEETIVVEEMITNVDVTIDDQSYMSSPVPFVVKVSGINEVPAKVLATFDIYENDLLTETIEKEFEQTTPGAQTFTYEHKFKNYADYRINSKIGNGLHKYTSSKSIRLGEAIQSTYVHSTNTRISIDEPLILRLESPHGSPLNFSIDFGDNQGIVVLYTHGSDFSRHKRSAVDGTKTIAVKAGDSIEIAENLKTLNVEYRYKNPGKYPVTLTVSNTFNEKSFTMCPPVFVGEKKSDSCHPPKVTFMNGIPLDSSEISPFQVFYSKNIDFKPEIVSCSPDKAVGYAWKLFKLTSHGAESLDEYCVNTEDYESPENSTQGLPTSHSLTLGVYQASLITFYEDDVSKSSKQDIFFEVTPTPLTAHLKGGNQTEYRFFDNMTINILDTGDADVADGFEGVKIYVFCYKEKNKRFMKAQPMVKINESSIIFEDTNRVPLKLGDFGECFDPKLAQKKNAFWYDGNGEITIKMQEISSAEPVYLEVLILKENRYSSFIQVIHVDGSGIIDLNDLDKLDELLNGDPNVALNIIAASTGALNSGTIGGAENEDASSVKDKKTQVRGKFVDCIDRNSVPKEGNATDDIMNSDFMGKATGALDGVTSAEDEVDPNTQGKSANAVGSMSGQMGDKLKDVDKDGTKDIGKSMLGAVGNTQGANKLTSKPAEDPRQKALEEAEISQEEKDEMDDPLYWIKKYDDPEGRDHPCEIKLRHEIAAKLQQEADAKAKEAEKDMSLKAAGASGPIADTVGGKMGEGEPEEMETPNLKMKLMKADPASLANNTGGGEDEGGFQMPNDMFGDSNETMNSAQQENTNNPFAFTPSASMVKSKVQALEFKDKDGKPYKVKDLKEPIKIMVEKGVAEIPVLNNFTYITSLKSEFQVHMQILTSNDSSIHIAMEYPEPSHKYEIRIRYGNNTLDGEDYDYRVVLPRELEEHFTTDEIKGFSDTKVHEFKHSFMLSNLNTTNGTYYIGVRLISGDIQLPFKSQNISFKMVMWQSGCRFFDEHSLSWKGDGCYVGFQSTAAATQCLCTHLTSFGGDGFVAPNTIDFSKAFANFSVSDNPVTFSVVITCIVLYIVTLIWARKQDQKDLFKWAAHPLEDNLPTDNYHYLVTVNTGAKKNAGTSSKVRFVLTGEFADTGVRKLADGKRNAFHQGSIQNYVLTVDDCLGPLTYLRIWHDNSGKGKAAGWQLDNIQIQDLQTGEKFCFLCDRWLAVEEDDGLIERILPVSSAEDLTNFKHMFSTTARRNLSDGHLWYSVFSRPTRSNFTRCQRITCCVSLMFLTMISNAMFYGQDEVKPAFEIVIGPIIINSTTLQISIYGTLVVMPASMLLLTIFKKAKPKESIIGPANMDAATKVKHTRKYQWKKLSGDQQVFKMEKRTGIKGMIDDFKEKRKKKKYENDMPEDDFEKRFAEEQNKNKKKKKGKPAFWPHWTLYIGYLIAFLSIFMSGFFVILYSMQWGRVKADGWMTTFLLSIFQNVIVVQPVKIMFLAAFFAAVIKKPKEFEPEDDDDDNSEVKQAKKRYRANQKRNVDEADPEVKAILDARMEENKNLKPLDLKSLEGARKKRMTEVAIENVLKEIAFYLLFLFILMFLAYQTRDPKGNMMWNVVKNNFIETSSPAWHDTSSTDKIYEFLEKNLIPNLYRGPWYNGKELKWRERLQTAEWYFTRIGPARIRQMRVKNGSCTAHSEMAHLFDFCRDEYNWNDDDTKPYDEKMGWRAPYKFNETFGKLKNDEKDDVIEKETSPWVYKDSIMLKNAPFFGKLNNYKGGGYVFTLDAHTAEENLEKLAKMKERGWLDPHTRAVFIEFTLYNANKNLFASVTMLAEIDSMGGISHMEAIKVFRLHSYVGAVGTLVMIGELIYVIFIITFLVKEVKKIIKLRCEYFKSFWNLMEFLVLLLSLIGIGMYIMRHMFAHVAMAMLQEEKCSNAFVNFNTIALWDETYVTILALLCYVATIKFLRLLRFNKRIALLSSTLSRSVTDLRLFMIMFGIVFMAYAQASYLIFGAYLGSYSGFLGAIQTLLALLLGDFDFGQLEGANAVLGPIVFFTFMVFVYMYLMTMFMAILNDAYADCQGINDGMQNELEICDYLYGKLCKVMGWNE